MTIEQFLEKRFSALGSGDYQAVYASYHPDAPFLQQFSDRNTYVRYAQQNLGEIVILSWSCPQQRENGDNQIEAILAMEIATELGTQFFYELALLIATDTGWSYHSAQKLGAEEFSGTSKQIDFSCFDNVDQKIRF